jgi:hypothetical protein
MFMINNGERHVFQEGLHSDNWDAPLKFSIIPKKTDVDLSFGGSMMDDSESMRREIARPQHLQTKLLSQSMAMENIKQNIIKSPLIKYG